MSQAQPSEVAAPELADLTPSSRPDLSVAHMDGRPEDSAPPPGCGCSVSIEKLEAELAAARTQVENLSIALTSSREIGAALGVLMCQHRLTNEDAFSVLRIVSQYTHRKLRDVAAELVFTGALDAPTMAQALSQLRS